MPRLLQLIRVHQILPSSPLLKRIHMIEEVIYILDLIKNIFNIKHPLKLGRSIFIMYLGFLNCNNVLHVTYFVDLHQTES